MKFKAKPVTSGIAEGLAIVSRMPISFTGGMDPDTGTIREPGHNLEGRSVAGKILAILCGLQARFRPKGNYQCQGRGRGGCERNYHRDTHGTRAG
jgi:hypothetical protein